MDHAIRSGIDVAEAIIENSKNNSGSYEEDKKLTCKILNLSTS
jgi:hypothetical protein